MLILTRYAGEKIMIGDNIVITILPNQRNSKQIKIGFECPADIRILREELYNEIKNEEAEIRQAREKINLLKKKLWRKEDGII